MAIIPPNGLGPDAVDKKPTAQIRTESQRETSVPRERYIFGAPQQKLSLLKHDPGFHYHWINDYPGRVTQAQLGGYAFVMAEEVNLLPGVVDLNTDAGSRVSMIVGQADNGEPLRAFLMKIPLDLYQENQAYHQQRVDQVDAAIRQGRTTADTASDAFYQPKGQPIRLSNKLSS